MKLTFIDSGVLIAAMRGDEDVAARASTILDDPTRTLATSRFVWLEVMPLAIYEKREDERRFYEAFFADADEYAWPRETLVTAAETEAKTYGLGAVDALHVAAARRLGAQEIVTTEKLGKPMHRVRGIQITTIHK